MPSSPKIPKEKILNTALDILIREGYSAINIKRLAGELGCSTQPISWQFGSMEGLREELADAAVEYANRRIITKASNFVAAFEQTGEAYADLAIDQPNLFRFIFHGESGRSVSGGLVSLLNFDRNASVRQGLAELLGVTPEQAEEFMNTMVIYTHGIASLIAAGVVSEDKENVHTMIRETGIGFLSTLGISRERAERFFIVQQEENI